MAETEKVKHAEHEHDDLVREQVDGFVHFLRNYAVVGLAVGFIIGQQAQTVIKQLIDSFITPLLNVLIGENFQKKAFIITAGSHHESVTWGKFVYVLLNFVFVMIFIYGLVKLFKLDKLVVKKKTKK